MRHEFKRLAAAAAVILTASLGATQASAHTDAFGYKILPDGTVDFWIGAWNAHSFAESPQQEGLLTLSGPGATGPYAFDMISSTLPGGLTAYSAGSTILSWQGVNVSGLMDGMFTAGLTGISFSKWADSIGPQTFTLDVVEQNIPEPATLALFGLGLAGLAFARRRKAAV